MTLPITPDIIRVSRPSEYDFDVTVNGEWIASAKNYHHADEAAHEIWYRAVLDQPIVAQADDVPTDNPDIDSTPTTEGPSPLRRPRAATPPTDPAPMPQDDDDDNFGGWRQPQAVTLQSIVIDQALQRNRICANCQGAHYGWQCPQIHIILFGPPRCSTCGDPLDWKGPGLCQACREWIGLVAA